MSRKRKKGKIRSLNKAFKELGMPEVEDALRLEDAKMIAEDEGATWERQLPKERERCGYKNCYQTKSEADRVGKARVRSHAGRAAKLRTYYCDECHQYHLTSRC